MASTVSSAFEQFRQAIEVSSTHRETAAKRKDRIVSLLENDFEILEAFPSGSIPRYTALSGYADLDIIVVLHFSKHIKDKLPSTVLEDIRKPLREYKTKVRRNGQAVTLTYDTWPDVDIVPVSRTMNSDGTVNHYNVPDMNTETWIDSRPRKHSTDMSDKNKSCGDMFKRVVKMIKWWNHQHGTYLQSFHIEVMALKLYAGTMSDYSWEVFRYFDHAAQMAKTVLWHEGDYIDSYLDVIKRQEAVKRLETARDKARDAWYLTYGTNNQQEEAIKIWRQIFGDKFPIYG